MTSSALNAGASTSLQSKFTRQSYSSNLEVQAVEEEAKEIDRLKNLPKYQKNEAMQEIFLSKAKDLTYPKNPALYTRLQVERKLRGNKSIRGSHASKSQRSRYITKNSIDTTNGQ